MRACKPLPYGQLTTALVPSPCFLRQSSTVAKVRETFCVSFVLIRFVIGELSEVGGRVGHGLVLAWFRGGCRIFIKGGLPFQERSKFHTTLGANCQQALLTRHSGR